MHSRGAHLRNPEDGISQVRRKPLRRSLADLPIQTIISPMSEGLRFLARPHRPAMQGSLEMLLGAAYQGTGWWSRPQGR